MTYRLRTLPNRRMSWKIQACHSMVFCPFQHKSVSIAMPDGWEKDWIHCASLLCGCEWPSHPHTSKTDPEMIGFGSRRLPAKKAPCGWKYMRNPENVLASKEHILITGLHDFRLQVAFTSMTINWHSPIGCGVSFELSRWACFHGSAKTYADWVWHSL